MSDEVVAPVVEAPPAPPPPKKEHWKVRAKRLREEAAAAGAEAPEAEKCAPAPAQGPASGFLSWNDFCARAALEMVLSEYGFSMLTNYQVEAIGPFYAKLKAAYQAMNAVYALGAKERL